MSVQFVRGVGPHRMLSFRRLGVKTVYDLLHYFPRWHAVPGELGSCAEVSSGPRLLVVTVLGCEEKKFTGRHMMKVVLQDACPKEAGVKVGSWTLFNRPYLARELTPGRHVAMWARVDKTMWGIQVDVQGEGSDYEFLSPETVDRLKEGKIVPIYHATKLLPQEPLRVILKEAVDRFVEEMPETLPPSITADVGLMVSGEALRGIHLAQLRTELEDAKKRLVFEELFTMQMYMAKRRRELQGRKKTRTYRVDGPLVTALEKRFPFELTGAQRRIVGDIFRDLTGSVPMNRLLQGDVGSGKTVVAAHALLAAVESGYQGAIMAPTEILAEQHYRTFRTWLEPLGLQVRLLVSGTPAKERRTLLKELKEGEAQIAVGTHALLESEVEFHHLGMMVIDERHKFGVNQRGLLQAKGVEPDCLMMTATPFPRALVLTLYGDTDLSILDEMPKGRRPVQTRWMYEKQREEVYRFIRERVAVGEQVFMVYPTIDSSAGQSLKAASVMARELATEVFPDLRLGLLHGRMSGADKDAMMKAFHGKKLDILIATSVIEVGIDVSQATVMVIEHAERFGLAQLHQLRGRVGRGDLQAYCFLMTGWGITPDAIARLRLMTATTDGFAIAEKDLELRGPGELLGTRQHGSADAQWLDVRQDTALLEKAREWADRLAEDAQWARTAPFVSWNVDRKFGKSGELLQVS